MQCWHLLNSFTLWVERCDDAKNSRLMEAAIAIIDNVKMCICMINSSMNRSEWVHHYSKIPIQQQSWTIYQTYFVTRRYFLFPSMLIIFNPHYTIDKVTWNLTDKWWYYWWPLPIVSPDLMLQPPPSDNWALPPVARCAGWPRVSPRPLGPDTPPQSGTAPGSVMTQQMETFVTHTPRCGD